MLFNETSRDGVIDTALNWIRSKTIAAYHGSRLSEEEIASVRARGLIPLRAEDRRTRIARALSSHPRWGDVRHELDGAIQNHGRYKAAGAREGQVHLTLSREGLVNGFNHYLTHGAEFDQHVAHALLGPEGTELLATVGRARLIQVAVPGPLALEAAHPHFSIDDIRRRGDTPNIVDGFLKAWSYRLAYPEFQSRILKIDSGMVFHSAVPPAWITNIETLPH
jgi:hypothetical protein